MKERSAVCADVVGSPLIKQDIISLSVNTKIYPQVTCDLAIPSFMCHDFAVAAREDRVGWSVPAVYQATPVLALIEQKGQLHAGRTLATESLE